MAVPCRWSQVLDQLEDDVHRSERDPGSLRSSWHPPADLGPLPVEMAERATRLVARQQRVADEISARIGTIARHQSLVSALDSRSAHQHRPSVYVDVRA